MAARSGNNNNTDTGTFRQSEQTSCFPAIINMTCDKYLRERYAIPLRRQTSDSLYGSSKPTYNKRKLSVMELRFRGQWVLVVSLFFLLQHQGMYEFQGF